MSIRIWSIALVLGAVAAGGVAQTTSFVPAVYPSIQAAINAAANGDTIEVAPGVYPEQIDFQNKTIRVIGTGGALLTTIDAQGAGTVVRFQGGEGPATLLRGFTIQNGIGAVGNLAVLSGMGEAGGIHMAPSCAATVKDCIVRANQGGVGAPGTNSGPNAVLSGGTGGPGGVFVAGVGRVVDCTIENNIGGSGGVAPPGPYPPPLPPPFTGIGDPGPGSGGPGGIYYSASAASPIQGLTILSNTGGSTGAALVAGSFVRSGGVGGIYAPGGIARRLVVVGNNGGSTNLPGSRGGTGGVSASNISLQSVLVAQNSGGAGPTPLLLGAGGGAIGSGSVVSSTFAYNVGSPGAIAFSSSATVAYSIVWDNFYSSGAISNITIGALGITVVGSDIQTGYAAVNGNIIANPLFVAPPADLRLSAGSPCLDRPVLSNPFLPLPPSLDVECRPRRLGALPDMGAHEFGPANAEHLGSCEDFSLSTLVNGGGNPADWERPAVAGDSLIFAMQSLGGTFNGATPILVAQALGAFPAIPFPAFPELHVDLSAAVLLDGFATGASLGPAAVTFAVLVPFGANGLGLRVRVQGLVVAPWADNAIFAASDAQDVLLP